MGENRVPHQPTGTLSRLPARRNRDALSVLSCREGAPLPSRPKQARAAALELLGATVAARGVAAAEAGVLSDRRLGARQPPRARPPPRRAALPQYATAT